MATISTQLRNFKEPDRDQQNMLFFAIPQAEAIGTEKSAGDGHGRMEIGAVLSLGVHGEEDSYVRV